MRVYRILAISVSGGFILNCDPASRNRNNSVPGGDQAHGCDRTCSMSIVAASFGASAIVLLVAAPGEPPVAAPDASDVAKAAVIRRLEPTDFPSFRGIVVKPSERMPGYVVCGEVSGRQPADPERFERFFVVVPGSFALLDRDGSELIDKYWSLNGCP
jgi:hypothetical protein